MNAPIDTDVIVVGAGPVGLSLACRLILSGVRVRVVEQRARAAGHSRSIGIHPPGLESLAEIGVADRLISRGVSVRDGMALDRSGAIGRLSFDRCPPPFRFVLAIPQWRTEEVLEDRLRELDPDALVRGVTVTAVEDDPDRARVRTTDGGTFEGAWVVGCDGAHSTVRACLDIGFPGRFYADRYVMGDFRDDTDFGPSAAVFLSREGLVESFPLPDGLRRWVVRISAPVEDAEADAIVRLVEERTGIGIDPASATMTSTFGVQRKLADTLATGRVLLAGDAAHVVSPIGGQGMNLGWLDARDAAATIEQMKRSPKRRADLLRSYSDRRRRAARRAARRSEFNMAFGRPSRFGPAKRFAVRAMLADPWAHLFARRFTMRGL